MCAAQEILITVFDQYAHETICIGGLALLLPIYSSTNQLSLQDTFYAPSSLVEYACCHGHSQLTSSLNHRLQRQIQKQSCA